MMLALPAKPSYLMLYARTCERCHKGYTNNGLGFKNKLYCTTSESNEVGFNGLTNSHVPSQFVLSSLYGFKGIKYTKKLIRHQGKKHLICWSCHNKYTKIEHNITVSYLEELCVVLEKLHAIHMKKGNHDAISS